MALSTATGAETGQNLAVNGDCEKAESRKPVGWSSFDAVARWGIADDGYKGKCVYYTQRPFSPAKYGRRKGEPYRGCGIVQGSSSGDTGKDAVVVAPHPDAKYFRRRIPLRYKISFWVKSEATEVVAWLQGWRTDEGKLGDRTGRIRIATAPKTAAWTRCENTVTLRAGTRKFALLFLTCGYQADGFELGRVCIDEVSIEPAGLGMTADVFPRIQIPDDPAVYVQNKPLDEILGQYRSGDRQTRSLVETTLRTADHMASESDEWYRQFFKAFEPRGIYTVACPVHPFKTRYYNDFLWSMKEPWRLVCKHCKEEGRQYYYYPNPDYPDDGSGCEPTDEVWARTHDEAWSKAHRGVPHDRWDGQTHGDSGGGKCYHFLGKYYVNASWRLIYRYAAELALAYHYGTLLFEPGSEQHGEAELYAHKAKVILLSYARATLGDDYLAAAEAITPSRFRERMEQFYRPSNAGRWRYEKLPGFRPFNHRDTTWGDPRWEKEAKRRSWTLYIFPGSWDWKAGIARNLMTDLCRLRRAFTEADEDIRRMCTRALTSLSGDRERVAMGETPPRFYLKRGAFEMEIHPYNLESGGDNLLDSTLIPKLQTGLYLRDDRIVENVARDVHYFHRNFLSQDGLGREGSPNYSSYAMRTMKMLYGLKGDFDKDAAFYDRELGGINLYRTLEFRSLAPKMMYYVTEDNYYLAWEDSCYRGTRGVDKLVLLEKYGGGIPKRHHEYLKIKRTADDAYVTFNRSVPLPPMLLHDRRKAILRAGRIDAPTVVSLDYTPVTGHYHWPVQHLMVHACGQELASDLGYLGSAHWLQRWIPSFPAHNCLTLRTENGDPNPTRRIRGDLRRHFLCTPFCQVVDTAEYDTEDWDAFTNGQNGEMSRQVLLMVPSPGHQYVIDIVRGRGGHTHDFYFHCHGLGFETKGLSPKPIADQEQSLYDYSNWRFKCSANWGARCFQKIAVAKSAGPWQATWSRIDDYRGRRKGDPLIHEDVFLRLWMVDEPGSDVIVGSGPAQRHFKNQDFGREMKIVCVRRPNTERIDTFLSVIEPYQHAPFVKSVRRLGLKTGNQYSLALAVETAHGLDYVITYGGPGKPSAVVLRDRGHTIATDADLAVVSYPNEGAANLLLAGGRHLDADGQTLKLEGPPQWEGRLLDFSDLDDTLIIESDRGFPEGKVLAGQPIVVVHNKDRSTYTIASIERLGAARYLIRLDDEPHLMNNWLRVCRVAGHGITVEPPPVLDRYVSHKVHAGRPGKTRFLGRLRKLDYTTIHNEWGAYMYDFVRIVTDDYSGVRPGQELGLTRLTKGHDRVSITNFAYVTLHPLQ